jgi:hypothetical protein
MTVIEVGTEVTVRCQIIDPACGDHPDLLLAEKGDKVVVESYDPGSPWPVLVRGRWGPFRAYEYELES